MIAPEPYRFEMALEGPLDMAASVERFRRWGDDLLDRWDGQTLVRVAIDNGRVIPYAAMVSGTLREPRIVVEIPDPSDRAVVERAVRAMWGRTPWTALDALARRDPVIARLTERYPGIRPIIHSDGFTAIARSISAQQVNLARAATIRRRLAERYGVRHTVGTHEVIHLGAEGMAEASVAALRELQLTTRKAEYLVDLARAVMDGALNLPALAALPDADVIARLTARRGLGLWTAEWYLARTLDRPVVAAGDLAVRKAVGIAYLAGAMPSEQRTRELTAHWGEAASLAQELMLYALAQPLDRE